MSSPLRIVEEVPGLYRVIAFKVLRETPGVRFDIVPVKAMAHIDSIDRVIHKTGAVSPGPVGDVARPWYMHPSQEDNLVVLHGTRYVDVYNKAHGRIESFTITPTRIERNGRLVLDGPGMLVWPTHVFHRIVSCEREGSASINFAVHHEGFNIKTNFNVYDLNTDTGEFQVVREGHLDQPV
jgi:hypothetical protein